MSMKVKETLAKEAKMMRDIYCETLTAMGTRNNKVLALDADLMSSSGMKPFMKALPDQFINCGIAESNMVGVSAGLSAMGYVPFAHTFGPFASRRVCDQIFMSCAYAKLNVRIVGSDPGVTAAFNGGTHMPFEDMAVLRAIPEMTLIEPSDSVQLKSILEQLETAYGTYFIRLLRKNAVGIYEEGQTFEIGKGCLLREGADVTLVASGILVAEALKAAAALAQEGIKAEVIDMFTWKPLDTGLLFASAAKTGAVVTCENHNILGGLGSACAEALVQTQLVPMEMIGVKDIFGQVGPEDFLRETYELNAANIVAAAKKAIARKA